jgi:hypothetical protein
VPHRSGRKERLSGRKRAGAGVAAGTSRRRMKGEATPPAREAGQDGCLMQKERQSREFLYRSRRDNAKAVKLPLGQPIFSRKGCGVGVEAENRAIVDVPRVFIPDALSCPYRSPTRPQRAGCSASAWPSSMMPCGVWGWAESAGDHGPGRAPNTKRGRGCYPMPTTAYPSPPSVPSSILMPALSGAS